MVTNLGMILKREKEKRGLTYEQFAEVLGIAKSALQDYIKGRRMPRFDTLEVISKNLDIPLSELLGGPQESGYSTYQFHPLLISQLEALRMLSDLLYELDKQQCQNKDGDGSVGLPLLHFSRNAGG